jgi:excisionase family DNA binding protein
MQATTPIPTNEPQFLTLPEASRRTGVSIDTLRRKVRDGTIPGALLVGKYRIRVDHLDAWMEGRTA